MQGINSRNIEARDKCLNNKSLGIYEYYGLDLRLVENTEEGVYAYFISNADLHKSRWYFHKVKVSNNKFIYDGLKFNINDFWK